ncbi:MAG: AAA family ATPase, partial [Anaerolineaceae bacterium]
DPHYMRKAMLVGARDFLTKPPSIDELITAIHRAGEMAIEFREIERQEAEKRAALEATQNELREPGSIITIYSPKGGVGSTTLATNLAISMLTDGKKVILIDGNTQYGDVSVFMNVQARTFLADLVSRADELDDDIVTDVISFHAETGLHILAAPPGPDIADKLTGEQFTKTIEFLRKKYNYIIIDTMPYLSEIVQASLVEADAIVLITSQDIPSVKSSSMFLNLADATGIERKRILFVMNHFDKRLGISPERIGESLKQEIVLTIPYDERLLVSASVNKGIPLMVDSKAHPFCKSIGALSARITERLEELKKTA